MKRATDGHELILGGEPRAELLPPELKAARQGRLLRRVMSIVAAGVVLVVIAVVATVTVQAAGAQSKLSAAEARTNELMLESAKYSEVRSIQNQIDMTAVARQLAAATEIDWRAYLVAVRASLPSDVTIEAISIGSGSPWVEYEQSIVPLYNPRVASLRLSLTSPTLPAVPMWLTNLRTLPGYADAHPGSVTRTETGQYVVEMVININEDARSNRIAGGQ
ncbi:MULTISPECIES: hypothetical protein [unclassified Cryobacterium]|uniref:hypothetical protein n=1 Tax=unclassified Cryobacterium TaxID=2649013 RepID=UPI00106A61BB|nr:MULTISPECIES: hypothetical protein [unclassified Cryobacterium]TFD06676.1 hypothetical protein E3T29_10495 [Cryobacterium sp. TMT1-66-1]TFD11255.1 hypothetical protein E3T35_11910 [Cryobacterium sp. TMT1-2-2]